MSENLLAVSTYPALLAELKSEIQEGMEKAQRAYEKEKVLTYWTMGKAISLHLKDQGEDPAYGKKLFGNLSRDLKIGVTLLYEMRHFYQQFPVLTHSLNLKWSQYRVLKNVKDEGRRKALETHASEKNLSKRNLDTLVHAEKKPKSKTFKRIKLRLNAVRGRLMTYEIFRERYCKDLLVDVGLNTYLKSGLKSFSGKYAQVSFKEDGTPVYKSVEVKERSVYTYKATVESIWDGDTIWVVLDVGFGLYLRQKIRFRGLDAPEKDTAEGIKARHFVEDALKGLPFVILKCHGRDKWNRYLMDVFYRRGENDPQRVLEKGKFLNQELFDAGLVYPYEEEKDDEV